MWYWTKQVWFLACLALLLATPVAAAPIKLVPGAFRDLIFEDIKPTRYSFANGILKAEVAKSASALILPFAQIRPVSGFAVHWRTKGTMAVKDAAQESEKDGDDAWFRFGLVLSGPAPTIPFLAPGWVKALGGMMQHPGDKLVYYLLGAKHPPGQAWPSPYSDDITSISTPAQPATDGWQLTRLNFAKSQQVVALWLMADGDNSGSTFTTEIKDLRLLP